MALTVGTDTYVTVAEFTAYALKRGVTLAAGQDEIYLTKAMDYLESRIYCGYKTDSTQALQFPRDGNTTVPQGIKNAQCIASILIGQGNDLQGNISQAVKREKVDTLEVEYQDGTSGATSYTALNDALRPFIQSGIKGARV